MRQGRRYGLSAAQKADIWHRWKVREAVQGLEPQGRVHEISGHEERITAIA
jgi:hypothetical protein